MQCYISSHHLDSQWYGSHFMMISKSWDVNALRGLLEHAYRKSTYEPTGTSQTSINRGTIKKGTLSFPCRIIYEYHNGERPHVLTCESWAWAHCRHTQDIKHSPRKSISKGRCSRYSSCSTVHTMTQVCAME